KFTLFNEIPMADLTHDRDCIEFHENDHWRHDRISAQLYIEMLKSVNYVFEHHDKISLPILYQLAGEDKVVDRKKSEELFEILTAQDKTKIVYEGFFHEIYNETNRGQPI